MTRTDPAFWLAADDATLATGLAVVEAMREATEHGG